MESETCVNNKSIRHYYANLVAFAYHLFTIIHGVVGRSALFDDVMMLIAKYGPQIRFRC